MSAASKASTSRCAPTASSRRAVLCPSTTRRAAADDELRPTVAVIPFAERGEGQGPVGEVLAEAVIAALSRSAELNVVSRLSTTAFRGRARTAAEIGTLLKAQYVLSGAYRAAASGVVLTAELADTRSGRVAWVGELKGSVAGIVDGHDELIDRLVRKHCAGCDRT